MCLLSTLSVHGSGNGRRLGRVWPTELVKQSTETHPNLVQTPSAEDDEGLFPVES